MGVAVAVPVLVYLSENHLDIEPMARAAAGTAIVLPQVTPIAESRGAKLTESLARAATRARMPAKEMNSQDAYCRIKTLGMDLPMGGELQIYTSNYEADEDGEPGASVYVRSSECPDGLFSHLRISRNGRVKKTLDCRSVTREHLYVNSAFQANVIDRLSSHSEFNLAISGDGYFVLHCLDEKWISRSGKFKRLHDGRLVSQEGCEVMATDGGPFMPDATELDELGCAPNGACIARVAPETSHLKYLGRGQYRVTGDDPLRWLSNENGQIFSNSLEDLEEDSDVSSIGPNWSNLPYFTPPESCEPVK